MTMSLLNRIANSSNEFQGKTKRVLCVCSAGLLRSPTAAEVLSRRPFNFNTRAAGLFSEFALIPVDSVLLAWADEIVCMEEEHREILVQKTDAPVICLNIKDAYPFRDPRLKRLIADKYKVMTRPK